MLHLLHMNESSFRNVVFIGIGIGLAVLFFYLFFPNPATPPVTPPGTQPGTNQPPAQQDQTADCGIESCHGLSIECGSNVPQMCTMEYRLGDFCRQFADCKLVKGTCQFVENSYFMNCKSCVQDCEVLNDDPMQAFECESKCREQFDSIL